jgi:WD40 repeat protein
MFFLCANSGAFSWTLIRIIQSYYNKTKRKCFDFEKAGSDGRIGLWDIRSSKSCLMYLDYEKSKPTKQVSSKSSYNPGSISSKCVAHTDSIVSLKFTRDGHHIISLGKDNALRLWDSYSGLNTLVNYGKIQLSSAVAETCLQMSCTDSCDPNFVYVPAGNNLHMFNILDGELKKTYKAHFESVNCCCYNPVLNEIYTGSKDRNILIWSNEKTMVDDSKITAANLARSSSLPKNTYSLLSNTGRNGFNSNPSTVNNSQINLNTNQHQSNTSIGQTSGNRANTLKRSLDNWSDDEET